MLAKIKFEINKARDRNKQAIDYYDLAISNLYSGNFKKAEENISKYKSIINYDSFPKYDRRFLKYPELSIIVVGYNTGAKLVDCIESVLNNNAGNYEIIVVDNGGNEKIIEKLLEFKLLYIASPHNFGPSEGRNIGTYFAKGEIISFLDDDALAGKGYVQSIIEAFKKHKIVGLRGRILPKSENPQNKIAGHYDLGPQNKRIRYLNVEGNSAFKKKEYVKLSGMNPLLFGHEGVELSYRIEKSYQIKKILYAAKTIIYHDFAGSDHESEAKIKRHGVMKSYLNFKYPAMDDFISDLDYVNVDTKHSILVMTLLVRDEEDIVRYNIDFHLSKGVDFVIATDNGSTDSTKDILREYEERGVLHLIDEPTHNHNQAEWNNRMAEVACAQYSADIIFHCDADEFWCPRSGNLKDEILKRQEDVLVVDVVNVLLQDKGGEEAFPKDTNFAVVNPIIAKDYQEETKHKNLFYFKYPPKVIFKSTQKLLLVAQGNHCVTNKDESITEGKAHDILIYHYPIRSRERFFKKVIRTGSAYEQNDKLDKSIGFHARRWYTIYKEGLLDDEYKKLILHDGEVDMFMREGFIEEIDFNNIILGHENKNDEWRFFNRKFEYEDKFQDFNWPWSGHKYFTYDLIRNVQPHTIVELGTHKGTSFFTFCQAVKDAHYDANLYAVDTWCGDEHAGFYDENVFKEVIEIKEKYYGGLKIELLRKTFDEAVGEFDDNSIDLLHIDGLHTYEAVKHDFDSWFPKVKNNGVILLHDIFISRDDFGVYCFWEELKKEYQTIEFYHSYGLGVLFKNGANYQALMVNERKLQIRYSYVAEDKKSSMLSHLENVLADRNERLNILYNSTSWRITKPLRIMGTQLKRLKTISMLAVPAIKFRGGLTSTFRKAMQVYRREGVKGIKRRIKTVERNDYVKWIALYDSMTDDVRVRMRERMNAFIAKPLISIIMPVYNPEPKWLVEAIESVRKQIYPWWELCIADDASTDKEIRSILERYAGNDKRIKVVFREQNGLISEASNSALKLAKGEWIALLDHADLLSEHALFWVADAINRKHDVCLIYSDEDRVDKFGRRHNPYFKCNWNEDLFYSQNIISRFGVYRTDLVRTIGGFRTGFEGSQDYDLALRYIEGIKTQQIHHIPRVLYHWREHVESTAKDMQSKPYIIQTGEKALNEHFQRRRVKAKAEFSGSGYRVHYKLPYKLPLVSLIICTRNALPLLHCCISSILKQTTYSHYEILIIDNGSDDLATLQYLKDVQSDARIRVIRDERPFNYSALNNAAVKLARGEIVGLLNNDLEVISGDWLTEMVSHALRPGIGAVGACLLYPNGTLQHGGIILGLGSSTVAGHVHGSISRNHHGFYNRQDVIQCFSAVTAACLVIQKNIFEEMGGLNELNLAVAYNDVDFCLRLCKAGYRNIWTPYAKLYHYESATRGRDDHPEKMTRYTREIQYMKDVWGDTLLTDPFYSPNLSLDCADFSLAWPPRILLEDF